MHWWWSWLLAGVGLTGLWLAGSRRRVGWAVGLAAQLLWVIYAVSSAQYGFILAAAGYATVYLRNWWRWRPTTPTPAPAPDGGPARGVSALYRAGLPATYPDTMISPSGRIYHARSAADAEDFRRCCSATPLHPHLWPYREHRR